MITDLAIKPGLFAIAMVWSPPRFLPSSYRAAVSCRLLCNNEWYLNTNVRGDSYATKLYAFQTRAGSHCEIIYSAIYNPASLDAGIRETAITAFASRHVIQHTHTHTYMHAHEHTHTHTHRYMHVHEHTHTYMHTRKNTHTHAHIHEQIFTQ